VLPKVTKANSYHAKELPFKFQGPHELESARNECLDNGDLKLISTPLHMVMVNETNLQLLLNYSVERNGACNYNH
jgi:hypothetical protein